MKWYHWLAIGFVVLIVVLYISRRNQRATGLINEPLDKFSTESERYL